MIPYIYNSVVEHTILKLKNKFHFIKLSILQIKFVNNFIFAFLSLFRCIVYTFNFLRNKNIRYSISKRRERHNLRQRLNKFHMDNFLLRASIQQTLVFDAKFNSCLFFQKVCSFFFIMIVVVNFDVEFIMI